jgi:hypothetical protein
MAGLVERPGGVVGRPGQEGRESGLVGDLFIALPPRFFCYLFCFSFFFYKQFKKNFFFLLMLLIVANLLKVYRDHIRHYH